MSNKPLPTDLPILSFSTAADLEAYLENEHATAPGFHLKLAKKASGIQSVSGAEAVELALCFGWIDGRANGLDDKSWLVRYTPRRAKSIWSQKNVSTIGRLLEEGRVRPAGIAAVEAAKADGRWERAYAGPATVTVPEDLVSALAIEPAAAIFFRSLNKSERYSVLWRIETTSPQNRAKRVEALVQMLSVGKIPGEQAKAAVKVASPGKWKAKDLADTKSKSLPKTTMMKATVSKAPARKNLAGTKSMIQDHQAKRPRRSGLRNRPGT